jgi:hypothetical protein
LGFTKIAHIICAKEPVGLSFARLLYRAGRVDLEYSLFICYILNIIAAAGFPRRRRLAFQEELPGSIEWIQEVKVLGGHWAELT